jgi:hypothetical protein
MAGSAMRYYFDLEADGSSTEDRQGTECGNFDDMRRLALRFVAEVASDSDKDISEVRTLRTVVRDEAGRAVYEAALTITGRTL